MFLYTAMLIPVRIYFFFVYLLFLLTLSVVSSYAEDTENLKQRLDQLQKTLQKTSPDEPREELENRLRILKELLKKEDLTGTERKSLEKELGVVISQEKLLINLEEAPLEKGEKRFFIEGGYWLVYTEGGDKNVASLFDMNTKQPLGDPLKTSPGPTGAFTLSAGYNYASGRAVLVRFWHMEPSGSYSRTADSVLGISGTEGSNYYYNLYPWGNIPIATKGVDRVRADSTLRGLNLDLLQSITLATGAEREIGVNLGVKYVQMDSDYSITYFSTTSSKYNIKSDTQNTLLGPVFGVYGKGPVYGKLRFKGLLDISITWDHVKAERFEYDNTLSQTAVNAAQSRDVAVPVIDGELGVYYPLGRNSLLSLDYKAAFFGGLPFELKTGDSILLETIELSKRDILFHGLTAGVRYSF